MAREGERAQATRKRLLVSVSALIALCAKQASRVSRKFKTESSSSLRIASKSPLATPKQLLTTFSNKAIPFRHKKRVSEESETGAGAKDGEFGDGGLWQRTILMGEKCQPPDFSGVIYYDTNGKLLNEIPPRSPRASPLPRHAFPAARGELY
ncbi:PREDICTED: uncharacterized protein LOC104603057 [Nelumbo nucifera]|uniref:Uncharacterized protein n=2 Tax=Nelumbo nucifera TaxID=4432 RepID=A0A822YL23_NELNU|nr:PREDICTED: uncharacterized protein LOC104603057 [Nelumbo nucifera]DAD31675.1 TPA_asm: hypothetical protein HUJ06_010526 [Nelumbo nucifera]DAD31677.1 TPA_asm: hypothetical protein HUJ06_010528 [Nelumbo nucifera]